MAWAIELKSKSFPHLPAWYHISIDEFKMHRSCNYIAGATKYTEATGAYKVAESLPCTTYTVRLVQITDEEN
ncbi:hypothetical protein [Edaphovirga cremea]|uniref:hypothetical protein n=1 Tax=Edaphovirga cremea TaxID=2267246 RepID=UPI003989AB0C